MTNFSKLLILMLYCFGAQNSEIQIEEPWEYIFNGKNFEGWTIIGSNAKAWVEEGSIVCSQVSNTPEHTFIRTDRKFSDFILEGEAKLDGELHTGFLFRCIDAAADTSKVRLYGYQVKIDPTPRRWTGGVFDDFGKTWHWWYTLENDERARNAFRMYEWNHFRIEAVDSSIRVWVNNIPTAI
jgi:hypothetical protein